MKSLGQCAIVMVGVLLLGGCAPKAPAVDPVADEAALRAGTATWVASYTAGDADGILALYAEDAVVAPPFVPACRGKAALREFLVKDMAASKAGGVTLNTSGPSDASVHGDLGWHAGPYTVTIADGSVVATGNYLEVWQRTNGKWLIVRDTWNPDTAPAPAAEPAPAPATTPAG